MCTCKCTRLRPFADKVRTANAFKLETNLTHCTRQARQRASMHSHAQRPPTTACPVYAQALPPEAGRGAGGASGWLIRCPTIRATRAG